MKSIKLCEGHKDGFEFVRILAPQAMYGRTPITKLIVTVVDKLSCVQCQANQKARQKVKPQ